MNGNPTMITLFEPYVYQTLKSIIGHGTVLETSRGSVRGVIKNVLPDHVEIDSDGISIFVRIQEIIWFMPFN